MSKNAKIGLISVYFRLISGVVSEMVKSPRRRLVRKYPAYDLSDSLGVPNIIFSENAGLPIARDLLAASLGTTVNSSSYTTKLAAAEEYGLTKGRYRDNEISITELGLSCVAYQSIKEKNTSLKKAAEAPVLFGKLTELFAGKELPEEKYFSSLLIRNFQIHPDQTREVIYIYKSNVALIAPIPTGNHLVIETLRQTTKESSDNSISDTGILYAIPTQEPQKTLSMLILSSQSMEAESKQITETLSKIGLETNLFTYKPETFAKIFDLNDSHGPFVIGVAITGEETFEDEENFLLGLAQGMSGNKIITITKKSDPQISILKHINPDTIISMNNDVNRTAIKILEILHSFKLSNINFDPST